jgi:hypothetical protein
VGGANKLSCKATRALAQGDLLALPAIRHAWASEAALNAAWPRFVAKLAANDNCGCHLWLGARSKGAGHSDAAGFYGSFRVDRTSIVRAHIFAWRAAGYELPGGFTLDHLCLNTLCVNALHMEPVTIAENTRRQWAIRRLAA